MSPPFARVCPVIDTTNLQLYLDLSPAFVAGFHVSSTLFSVEATVPSSREFPEIHVFCLLL